MHLLSFFNYVVFFLTTVQCFGFFKTKSGCNLLSTVSNYQHVGLVVVGYALAPSYCNEIRLDHWTFLFRVSFDLKVILIDKR